MVVLPRAGDARSAGLREVEPNDTIETAQMVAWAAGLPKALVEAQLASGGSTRSGDVDVFRFTVPGPRIEVPDAMSSSRVAGDAAAGNDTRALAKRLAVEIEPDPALALSIEILDDQLHVLESTKSSTGGTAGLPNVAAWPGHDYYVRVRAAGLGGKGQHERGDAGRSGEPGYRLSLAVLDFELADEREPNDRAEAASGLAWQGVRAMAAGLLGWRGDEDWYRLPLPSDKVEPGWLLSVELTGVSGVAAELAVHDQSGKRLVGVRGRKGERLQTQVAPPMDAQAGAEAERRCYVVVRSPSGSNREQRYLLTVDTQPPSANDPQVQAESEPNDDPAHATRINCGTITGRLPVGDIDLFRYASPQPRSAAVELTQPAHVNARLEIVRERDGEVLATDAPSKGHEEVRSALLTLPGEPVLVRMSHSSKRDGNASEPYLLRLACP